MLPSDPIWIYPTQATASGTGRPGHSSSDPGATVGWLWEEPADIAQGHVTLRLILGNADASENPWRGCNVYLSHDDATYSLFSTTYQRSIIGELSAALPAGAGEWQPAATCDVDITVSPGTLVSTDAASAQAGVNLCLIGDEVCSFVTAALIGPNEYTLTGFQRGWFGTAVVLHNIGERFAMLSSLQGRVDLPISAKGQTWHVKLASLNVGGVEQALSAAVHLALDGKGLGTTLNNTGLHLRAPDDLFELIVTPGSNLSADRILTITTGDAARTLTFEANAIVSQDYSTDSATVQFATLTLTTGLLAPQVGPAADPDLLGFAPNALQIRGKLGVGIAPGARHIYVYDSVAGQMSQIIENASADAAAGCHIYLKTAGGGDLFTEYVGPGAMYRAFGIDHSDADKFVWSAWVTLGTNNLMTLDASGNLAVVGNLLVNGGNVGLTANTDLIVLNAAYVQITEALRGPTAKVLAREAKKLSFTIQAPVAADDFEVMYCADAMLAVSVKAHCIGGTNVVGCFDIYEADGTTLHSALDGDWTITTAVFTDATIATHPDIPATYWLRWRTTSVSGAVDSVTITLAFTET